MQPTESGRPSPSSSLSAAGGPAAPLIPALAAWFDRRFGEPTPIQRQAWPPVAAGASVLISATTGAGKTLAAFSPIFDRLLGSPPSTVACLYIAPLRALVADMARTLDAHLAELTELIPSAAALRIAVRTGDTPARQRQALRTRPPAVLLTTPESLAVLLSQPAYADLFRALRWVVIDEVHALAPTKRGADLTVSLERLETLAPRPLQRIGLSATAAPLSEAGWWLVGASRPFEIAHDGQAGSLELTVEPLTPSGHVLADLVRRLAPALQDNRATLVFTNTRRLAEQLAWALRRNLPDWEEQIAAHHSSLSAARRRQVEEDFKAGRLRAVVSSTSLELGIDAGPVDLAVLVHPPGDVIRLLQRVGRAGHGPARVRRGLVLTAGAAELLEAAVTVASGRSGQCEPLHMPNCPLDVLCQQLAGMACVGTWSADEAYALVRRATPFADLSRADFDDCLRYLFGLDQMGRPWLPPRLSGCPDAFTICDAAMARLVRRNLGTILNEPRSVVRRRLPPVGEDAELYQEVGDVDEAYAERLLPGDRFVLDGRCLEVRTVSPGEVIVDEAVGRATVPAWAGEGWPLSTELARRLYHFRIQAVEALRDGRAALAALLCRDYGLDGQASDILVSFFEQQERLGEVPEGGSALVEVVAHADRVSYWWHTPLNRLANDALARVATHRLARVHGLAGSSLVADLGFALIVPGGLPGAAPATILRALLGPQGFDADLEACLEQSQSLRGRFAAVATTGLMLLRNPRGSSRKVGGEGWAARRLFDQVGAHDLDFVLLRQARRELRAGLCDATAARAYAVDLANRPLRCRNLPCPSPFAAAWTQVDAGAAEPPSTPVEALERLHEVLHRATARHEAVR